MITRVIKRAMEPTISHIRYATNNLHSNNKFTQIFSLGWSSSSADSQAVRKEEEWIYPCKIEILSLLKELNKIDVQGLFCYELESSFHNIPIFNSVSTYRQFFISNHGLRATVPILGLIRNKKNKSKTKWIMAY